jgi:ER-bound oxygenase mpaB/B'/Rubber oxygenase, catalytic domain
MNDFVDKNSIVREIWGRGDTVLLIFAGASAEFALNKAVDWLYFTGRLPSDPLGRLFSTVTYAQKIVFSSRADALASIDKIATIHRVVEQQRAASIPTEAYLDVLFLLIDYSIRSFELLQRRLTREEKGEVFAVFGRLGIRMGLAGLPDHYEDWVILRAKYLGENLVWGPFSADLYQQYRKHLGPFRYWLLLQGQALLVPAAVRPLLPMPAVVMLRPVIQVYKLVRWLRLDGWVRRILLPKKFRPSVTALDLHQPGS